MNDELYGWAVFVNSDLTEGRGCEVIQALCRIEATAIRLARHANVQGSDGVVRRVRLFIREYEGPGYIYGPVQLKEPSAADEKEQAEIDRRRAVEEKARALGLSAEELLVLRGTKQRI